MDYIKLKNEITEYITAHLKESRLKHVYGVRDTAVLLSIMFGEDPKKAEICALFHDMYKWLNTEQVNEYVKKYNLEDKYLNNPNLAHSKLAAYAMKNEYCIDDLDMINAVSYHTTGRANMSKLEKIIALADFIEPNRVFKEVYEARKLAKQDLDKACLYMFEQTILFLEYRIEKGEIDSIDSDTLNAKEYLWKTLNM